MRVTFIDTGIQPFCTFITGNNTVAAQSLCKKNGIWVVILGMSLLRKLFAPKPAMSLELANHILNDFRGSQRYKVIEPTIWLPVDCAPHQPQQIYNALTTLAQHDGQWDTYQAIARQLAQYSDDAYSASLATWAMVTDEVERLSETEIGSRRRQQADSADIIARIEQDFDSLKRSKPRMVKPRFSKWQMDYELPHEEQVRSEYIVKRYAELMQEDCQNMSFAELPARPEEIAWAMANLYVLGSKQTYDEYQEFAVAVMFLANADDPKTAGMMRDYKSRRMEEWHLMSVAEKKSYEQQENTVERRSSMYGYWSSTWKMMCHRVEVGCCKEFVEH